jgi:putative transposase
MSTERKRELAMQMHEQEQVPVATLCDLLELSRSSYYYQGGVPDDTQLRAAIDSVITQFPTYGTRRVTHQLRRPPYRWRVNRKRVQRVMRAMDALRTVKRHTCRTTDSRHGFARYDNLVKDLQVSYPEQVWVSDITYIRLASEFVFLAVIMDVFTRTIRGWHLGRSVDQFLTLTALEHALAEHVPSIHHSDQGVQYAATAYVDVLTQHGAQISMASVGAPEENPYAERLIRTIKEEEVDLAEYQDFADARRQIGRFIDEVYQHKRIHSALGYLTPAEFEQEYWAPRIEQMSPLNVP